MNESYDMGQLVFASCEAERGQGLFAAADKGTWTWCKDQEKPYQAAKVFSDCFW